MMEAIRSSEPSALTRATPRNILEDDIVHSHRRESSILNTYKVAFPLAVFKHTRRMVSSGILRRVVLVRTDDLWELSASFIRVTRNGELGTKTSNLTNTQKTAVPLPTFEPTAPIMDPGTPFIPPAVQPLRSTVNRNCSKI
jgi:hypothetical protein